MSSNCTGGCNCGAIRYEISAEPIMAGHCQCRDCQHMSGTGHASHVGFPRGAVKLQGKATHWEKTADSGNRVTRAFCPTCGSPVYSNSSGMPDFFIVEAASLVRSKPQMVVYASSAFAWDHVDPTLPRFEKMPNMTR